MLAKDYRMRCDLDSVVEDDWVTFEGSEPLFEEDDSFGANWNDFTGGIAEDGRPVLKALLIDNSISKRKMLLQQLNSIRHVMCACSPNDDTAVEIVDTAVRNCPEGNFDMIFCELVQAPAEGHDTVQRIRDAGFKGRIVGLLRNSDNIELYLKHGAHNILRRPIATRELNRLFDEVDLLNSGGGNSGLPEGMMLSSSMSTKLAAMSLTGASNGGSTSNNKFSAEEVEAAITTSKSTQQLMTRAESSMSMRSSTGTMYNDEDDDDAATAKTSASSKQQVCVIL